MLGIDKTISLQALQICVKSKGAQAFRGVMNRSETQNQKMAIDSSSGSRHIDGVYAISVSCCPGVTHTGLISCRETVSLIRRALASDTSHVGKGSIFGALQTEEVLLSTFCHIVYNR